jgi:DNA-binding Lrp family transcriptional regulator
MKIDDFDAPILNLLQENNQLTSNDLGRRVNLACFMPSAGQAASRRGCDRWIHFDSCS